MDVDRTDRSMPRRGPDAAGARRANPPASICAWLAILALLAVGAAPATGDEPAPASRLAWNDSLPAAMAAGRASGRPVLALFWDPDWGVCRVKEETFADPELGRAAAEFELAFVDFTADREAATVHRARRFVLICFGADGRELLRVPFADRGTAGDPRALARDLRFVSDYVRSRPGEGIAPPVEGRELLGTPAAPWLVEGWLNGGPFRLEDLRGRVVLIRFFTHTCGFCSISMPAFEEIHQRYAKQGLTVIGFYHPKPFGSSYPRERVEEMAAQLRLTFPIALDTHWATLKRCWLDGAMRDSTSVSLLIDRKGIVRWLHPGPELHPNRDEGHEDCDRRFRELEEAVKTVLQVK